MDAACDDAGDCPIDTVCTSGGSCAQCEIDDECDASAWCESLACAADRALDLPCSRDAQCATGRCAERTPDMWLCGCNGDGDCPAGEVCTTATGDCAGCTSDAQCGDDYCVSGTCRACTVDRGGCLAGEYCRVSDYTCQPKLAVWERCDLASDCVTNLCSPGGDGILRCKCDSAEDCGADLICTNEGRCEGCTPPLSGCVAGQFCDSEDLTCKPLAALGEPCAEAYQCASASCGGEPTAKVCTCDDDGDCGDEYCGDDAQCHVCKGQEGCAAEEYCREPDYTCQPELAVGTACNAPSDCDSGFCEQAEPGQFRCFCHSHEDCPGGFCDTDGVTCRACLTGLGCADDEYCRLSDHTCQPKFAVWEECQLDTDCSSGFCRPDANQVLRCMCLGDDDCGAGEVCAEESSAEVAGGACYECLTPNDGCNPSTEYCCAGNTCAPLLGYSDQCQFDYQCGSGECVDVNGTLRCACADGDCGANVYCAGNGVCQPGCDNDDECGGGDVCALDTHECVDCLETADCAVNLVCNTADRLCQPGCETSAACGGDTPVCHPDAKVCVECASAVDCGPPGTGVYCDDDDTCQSGCGETADCAALANGSNVCDVATNTCVDCLSTDNCADPLQCDTMTKTCVTCVEDEVCAIGTFCGPGNTCIDGCNGDDRCPASQWCDASVCEADKAYGGTCGRDAECLSNECGRDDAANLCGCAIDGDCSSQSGGKTLCNTASNECVACLDDGDCTAPALPWCDPDGVCSALNVGDGCDGPDECSSGICTSGMCRCDSSSDCYVEGGEPTCCPNGELERDTPIAQLELITAALEERE